MKNFIVGVVITLLVLVAGAYISITLGWVPANADAAPGALETWAAHKSLRATIKRDAPTTPVPVALTDANIISGIKLYAVNCAICHGAADGKASNVASGLFQHAPQLSVHDVTDDPEGKIYWFVKHGVRLTGMPSFSGSLTEDQIWQVVLFLKHMDKLSPAAEKAWKSVPSAKI
ncbi:MAG TPA: cytochrome c [bacterium]|jgi:thiosulfate dehydrogenase|nr:cytochrome c [bacterium]